MARDHLRIAALREGCTRSSLSSGNASAISGVSRRALLAGISCGVAGLAGFLSFPTRLFAATLATDVRFGQHDGFTRIAIDLSSDVRYSLFTLADPNRVVIDLPEIEWKFQGQGVFGSGNLVTALRYGLFQQGNSRIVLDLARPALVKQAFVLPPNGSTPWRLVIDLGEATPEAFLAASGPEKRVGSLSVKTPPKSVPSPSDEPVRTPSRRPQGRKPVIVLDPGHGGIDPGAIGVTGVYEKNITLAAAREFKAQLVKTGRYDVYLTRERDVFLQLRERIAIARKHKADLFISIHADAIANPATQGLSVYTLSEQASDSEAAALAENENKADIIGGIDLTHESAEVTNILIDLAQRETMNLSSRMAEGTIAELRREVTLLPRSHRFAGFAVLKAPDVPSMLIEMGYLSNSSEEKLLRKAEYRARLGTALVRGADRYFTTIQRASAP